MYRLFIDLVNQLVVKCFLYFSIYPSLVIQTYTHFYAVHYSALDKGIFSLLVKAEHPLPLPQPQCKTEKTISFTRHFKFTVSGLLSCSVQYQPKAFLSHSLLGAS